MCINIYDPLVQFESIFLPLTCAFDVKFILLGLIDLAFILQLSIIFAIGWIVTNYYNTITRQKMLVDFDINQMVKALLTLRNHNYFDIFLALFGFIFLFNIVGLIPYAQTATSQIIITLGLACVVLLLIWLHFALLKKIICLNHFLPNGTPLWLILFIIFIELISNLSRVISLSVRLFANITSGHALLKILASFGFIILIPFFTVWNMGIVVPSSVIFLITSLETIIAFLQAYVFVTLIGVYVAEQG